MEKVKSRFAKWLLFGLLISSKLGKFAVVFKVAKPFTMFLSMSISAIAYAFWLGPWFAIGLVLLLLIHEMGHVAAMRIKGYETATPVFIPFLGAAIFAPKFKSREDEAFIGIGGPLLGSIGAVVVFFVWYLIPDKNSPLAHVMIVLTYSGVFLNLFNLIPISPLDGGRVTQAVGEWFKYLGLILIVGIIAMTRDPILIVFMIIVLEDFSSISFLKRAVLACLLWISMFILVVFGIGDQGVPWWIEIFYLLFGALVALRSVGLYRNSKSSTEDELEEKLPPLSARDRMRWCVSYFILSLILIGILIYQAQFLPAPQ